MEFRSRILLALSLKCIVQMSFVYVVVVPIFFVLFGFSFGLYISVPSSFCTFFFIYKFVLEFSSIQASNNRLIIRMFWGSWHDWLSYHILPSNKEWQQACLFRFVTFLLEWLAT